MSGEKQRVHPNQPITFNKKQVTNDDKKASYFCKQSTTIVPHTSEPIARCVKRQLLCDHPIDHTLSAFTTEQVVKAIKQSNNLIAAGSNGLSMFNMKHLGLRGHAFLLHLFNLSKQTANIPSICKQAALMLIPKAVKPRHLRTFCRPIFPLYPSKKVLERLLLPALEGSLRLAGSQPGFRKMSSTTSALLPLTEKVAASLDLNKPPLRTVTIAIDLLKAVKTVNHTKLIEAISATDLHQNITNGCRRI